MDGISIARELLRSALQLGPRADELEPGTPLMGHFPEFNSLTVVGLIAGIEEQTGAMVDDGEISEEVFETVGTLAAFIDQKLA